MAPLPSIPNNDESKWLSMSEGALLVPYSAEYLSLLARKGKLTSKKIGNTWYTTRPALEEYMKRQMIRTHVQNGNYHAAAHLGNKANIAPEDSNKNLLKDEIALRQVRSFKTDTDEYINNSGILVEAIKPGELEKKFVEKKLVTNPIQAQVRERQDSPVEAIEHMFERVLEKRSVGASGAKKTFHATRVRYRAVFTSRVMVVAAIICALSLTVFPVPLVFSFFEKSFTTVKEAIMDSNTVMGFRPGTHANEILLLDKQGNVSIMGHIETEGQLRSYIADGTAPIVVDSTTKVENLNADSVDGVSAEGFTLAFVTKNGNVTTEDVYFDGNVEVGKTLKVKGATRLLSTLEVDGGLQVFGNAEFANVLRVVGPAYFESVLTAQSNIEAKGDINASGNLSVKKNINVRGGLEVGSSVIAKGGSFGSLGVRGDFSAGGKITLGNEDDDLIVTSKNVTIDTAGNASFDGGLSAASLGVTNLTATNSTTTNATSTNLYAENANFGNVNFGVIVSNDINFTNATGTNATSTNLYAVNAVFDNLTSNGPLSVSDLDFTNATGTNATTTNFYSDTISGLIAYITSIVAEDVSVGALTATNSTTTNATSTNNYSGNLTADTATITNLTSTNSTSTNSTTTNAYVSSLTAGNATSTNLYAITADFGNLAFINATGTNATTTNFYSTTASSTNLYSTNAELGSVVLGNATSTNFYSETASSTNLYTTNFNLGSGYLGSATTSELYVTGLTDGRVPFVTAGGLLTDSSLFTFDSSIGKLTTSYASTTQISSTGNAYLATLGGNVGIGTASPSEKLEVSGNLLVTGNSTTTNATTTNLYFSNNLTGPGNFIVNSSGNVGIGTTTPSVPLHLQAADGTSQLRIEGTSAYTDLIKSGTNLLFKNSGPSGSVIWQDSSANSIMTVYIGSRRLAVNGIPTATITGNKYSTYDLFDLTDSVAGDIFKVTNAGLVGIGTANPTEKLEVSGNLLITGNSTTTNATTTNFFSTNGTFTNLYSDTLDLTNLIFVNATGTNATTTNLYSTTASSTNLFSSLLSVAGTGLNVIAGGNVGIGTTAPGNKLDVVSSVDTSSDWYTNSKATLKLTNGIGDSVLKFENTQGRIVYGAGGASDKLLFSSRESGAITSESIVFDNNGNVGIGTTAPGAKLNVIDTQTGITTGTKTVIFENDTTMSSAGNTDITPLNLLLRFRGSTNQTDATKGASGLSISAFNYNTATVTNFSGLRNDVRNLGAGTVTNMQGLWLQNFGNTGGGTITNGYGIKVDDLTTATNNYGIGLGVSSGANKYNIYASGTARNYFAGNVGIGTIAPSELLEINSAASNSSLRITGAWTSMIKLDGGGGFATIAQPLGDGTLRLGAENNAATNHLVITSTGNVGIGTTTPGSQLHIYGASGKLTVERTADYPIFDIVDSGGTPQTWRNQILDTGALAWQDVTGGGASKVVILPTSGNVGIGTTSPTSILQVISGSHPHITIGASTDANGNAGIYLRGKASGVETQAEIYADYNSGLNYVGNSSTPHEFLYGATSLMVIRNDGNVGIGTTTPITKFSVGGAAGDTTGHGYFTGGLGVGVLNTTAGTIETSGNVTVGGALTINGSAVSSATTGQFTFLALPTGTAINEGTIYVNPTSAGTNNVLLGMAVNGTEKLRVDAEGDVQITGLFNSTNTSGTNDLSGSLAVDQNTTLGDASSDTVSFNARVNTSIIPSADLTYDLGTSILRWGNVFAGTTTISQLIAGGTASSTFIINDDNATADTEDASLEFSRGSLSPNAALKWNSSLDRFEFNDFPLYVTSKLDVAGTASSSFAGPLWVTGTPQGTSLADASLYINPSSASTDYSIFSVGVAGVERFRVDAEGDIVARASFGIENALYDVTDDTLTINDKLQINGNEIKDSTGTTRIGLGTTNTVTGNLTTTGNFIAQGAGPHYFQNGNVGIGTTTPSQKLEVNGNTLLTNNTNWYGLVDTAGITRSTLGYGPDTWTGTGGNSLWLRNPASGNKIYFGNTNPSVTFDLSSGNVGIGTTTPTTSLTIQTSNFNGPNIYGTQASGVTFKLQSAATGGRSYYLQSSADSSSFGGGKFILVDGTAGAARVAVDSSGNVGIGTTSPTSNLHVSGTGAQAIKVDSTNGGSSAVNLVRSSASAGDYQLINNAGQFYLNYSTDESFGSTFLSVLNSGNVGIGTASPSEKLYVSGNAIITGNSTTTNATTTNFYSSNLTSGSVTVTGLTSGRIPFATTGGALTDSSLLTFDSSVGKITTTYASTTAISSTGFANFATSGGNVGVGTTDPRAKLAVESASTGTSIGDGVVARFSSLNGSNARSEIGFNYFSSSATNNPVVLGYQATSYSGFTSGPFYIATRDVITDTAPTERFTILGNGNVGIGDTSPVSLLSVGSNDAFQVDSLGAIASSSSITTSGPITIGTDVAISRGTANRLDLGSGDSLRIYGGGYLDLFTTAFTEVIKTSRSGDSVNRFTLADTGDLSWGSGSASRDTNLYRSAADTLKTDDAFIAAGGITSNSGLTVTIGGITVTGNSTITGTLTGLTGITSSGTASLATVNVSSLTASRFVLTDASKNLISSGASSVLANTLTDETGSGGGGVAVFSVSPQFTTSLTTNSSSFDLFNTTATTINFGGAATSLTLGASTGTTTVNNGLVVGGTDLVVQQATGNVGLGTTDPKAELHVGKATTGTSLGDGTIVRLESANAVNARTEIGFNYFGSSATNNPVVMGYQPTTYSGFTSGPFYIATRDVITDTAPTERLTILGNGNVGIGTISPTTILNVDDNSATGTGLLVTGGGSGGALATFTRDVGGTGTILVNASGANPQVSFNDTSNTFSIGVDSGDGHSFKISDNSTVGTSDRFTIDTAGNVGVGTTTPTGKFQVAGTLEMAQFFPSALTGNSRIRIGRTGDSVADENAIIAWDDTLKQLQFAISGDTVGGSLNIANGGNVGIGTTAPEKKLHIYNTGTATILGQLDTNLRLQSNTTTSGAGNEISFRGISTAAEDTGTYAAISAPLLANGVTGSQGYLSFSTKALQVDTTLSERMRITQSGNVGIGTTAPNAFKLEVAGNIGPEADNTRDLGSLVRRFANVYGTNIVASSTSISTLTPGSVVFAGTGGALSQDNSNFFWDDTNNELGLGTNNPAAALDILKSYSSATAGEQFGQLVTTRYNIADTSLKQGLRLNTNSLHTTGTLSQLIGALSLVTAGGNGGTTSSAQGYWSRIDSGTGAAITNAYNLYVADGTGAGTIGTQYGLFVSPLSKGVDNYAVYTSGSTKSYFGGNVGIGTTAPTSLLHIAGGGSGANGALRISSAAGTTYWEIGRDNATTGDFTFSDNGVENMRITIGGNVGIGTTTPDSKFNVNGGYIALAPTVQTTGNKASDDAGVEIRHTGYLDGRYATRFLKVDESGGIPMYVQETGNDEAVWASLARFGSYTTNSNKFETFGQTSLATASGNVGIGTTAPTYKLHVDSSTAATTMALDSNTGVDTSLKFLQDTGVKWNIYTEGTADTRELKFNDGSSDLMTIQRTTGNVGIGTTTPQAKFHVLGTGTTGIRLTDDSGADANWELRVGDGLGPASGNAFAIWGGADGSEAQRLTIDSAGNVGIGTTSPAVRFQVGSSQSGGGDYNAKVGFGVDGALHYIEGRNHSGTDDGLAFFTSTGGGGAATEKFRVSGDGNVGIGTTNPLRTLDVYGTSAISNNVTGAGSGVALSLLTNDGANNGLRILPRAASASYNPLVQADDVALIFSQGAVDTGGLTIAPWSSTAKGVRINNSGNVGIGTTAPTSRLQIGDATVSTANVLTFGKTETASESNLPTISQVSDLSPGASNDLRIASNSSSGGIVFGSGNGGPTTMVLNASGNLGIGTTAPGYKFTVSDNGAILGVSTASAGFPRLYFGGTDGSIAGVINRITGSEILYFGEAADTGGFQFRTTGDSSFQGNLGVGDTTPTYKLDVTGTGRFTGALTADTTLGVTGLTTLSGGVTIPVAVVNTLGTNMKVVYGDWGASNHVSGVTLNKWIKVADFTINGNYNAMRMSVGMGGRRPGSSGEGAPFQMYVQARNSTTDLETPTVWVQSLTSNAPSIKDVVLVRRSGTGVTNNVMEVWVQFGANWSDSFPVEINYWGTGTMDSLATTPQPQQDTITAGGTEYAVNSYAFAQNRLGIGSTVFTPNVGLSVGTNGANTTNTLASFYNGDETVVKILGVANTNGTGSHLHLMEDNSNLYGFDTWYDTGNNVYKIDSYVNSVKTEVLTMTTGGNVGIGTTAPSQKLDVVGNIELGAAVGTNRYIMTDEIGTGTGKLTVQAGAGSATYGGAINLYAQAHATNPGWVRVGIGSGAGTSGTADEGRFTVNDQGLGGGTDIFTVLRTGNVGIGTTNPINKLDVRGDAQIINSGTNALLYLGEGTGAGTYGQISWNASDDTIRIGTQTGGTVATFTEGGNVGIGTTTPSSLLTIDNGGTFTLAKGLTFGDGDSGFWEPQDDVLNLSFADSLAFQFSPGSITGSGTNSFRIINATVSGTQPTFSPNKNEATTGIGSAGTNILSLIAGGTNSLNVISTGNVGIGTTTPDALLSVSATAPILKITTPLAGGNQAQILQFNEGASGVTWSMGNSTSPNNNFVLAYGTSLTSGQLLTVQSDGNVGIGTTAPGNNAYAKLELYGTASSASGPHIVAKTSADAYPVFHQLNWAHDNVSLNFDSYYDGTFRSADAGSNFQIYKTGDLLRFRYDSGIAAGSAVTWNDGIDLDTSGNVGIGTTAPQNKLHVLGGGTAGTPSIDSGTSAIFQNSASASAESRIAVIAGNTGKSTIYLGDTDSATIGGILYDHSTNSLNLATAGISNSRLTINSAGNIGVGTSTPDAKFEVTGGGTGTGRALVVKDSNNADRLTVLDNGNVGIYGVLSFTGAAVYNALNMANSNIINVNNMTISDGGASEGLNWADQNWYIDTSPLDRSNAVGNLNLYGTANNIALWRPSLWVYNATNYTTATAQSDGGLDFTTTGTGDISFNPGGNVGIGTTSPSALLHVDGTFKVGQSSSLTTTGVLTVADSAGTWGRINTKHIEPLSAGGGLNLNYYNGGYVNIGAYARAALSLYGAQSILNTSTSTVIYFNPDGDSYFNNGNIGINDATPTYKLDVNGTGRFTGAVTLDSTLTVTGATTLDGDIIFADNGAGADTIRENTPDAGDDRRILIAGGGAASSDRGAYLGLNGNEYASEAGYLVLNAGSTGGVRINHGASGVVYFDNGGGYTDTNLYRSAANLLKTDDALTVAGTLSTTLLKGDVGSLTIEALNPATSPVIIDGNDVILKNSSTEVVRINPGSADVTGTLTATGNITSSSASASALTLSGATSGINFTSSTGVKTIATGGTTDLNLAPGGNVGVGDSTPTYKLDVNGTLRATGVATLDAGLTMSGSASNIALGSNYLSGDGADEGVYVDAEGDVGLGVAGAPAVTGLQIVRGTQVSDPATIRLQSNAEAATHDYEDVYASLEFGTKNGENGAGAQEVSAYIKSIDTRAGATTYDDGGLAFGTLTSSEASASTKMILTDGGNLGIGITAPKAKLHVDTTNTGTTVGSGIAAEITSANIVNARTELGFSYAANSGTYTPVLIGYQDTTHSGYTSGNFYIATRNGITDVAPAERLTILPNGNVGIGDTTPDDLFSVGASSQFKVDSSGNITSGTVNSQTISSAASFTGTVNATTGFKVGNAAAAGKILRGNGTNYVASTATFADTYGASTLLYSNGANTVTGLATGNNGVLITSGTGVPSISSTIPTATQDNITRTGALVSGSIASGFGTIATANTITGTTINGTTGINTGAGAGTLRINSSGAISNITTMSMSGVLTNSNATASALTFSGASSGINFTNVTGVKTIATGGTTDLDLAPGGNVGIGQASPVSKLEVYGQDITVGRNSNDVTNSLRFVTTDNSERNVLTGYGSAVTANDYFEMKSLFGDLRFTAGGSEAVRILETGNVGIGDSSPTEAKLSVVGGGLFTGVLNAGDTAVKAYNSFGTNSSTHSLSAVGDLLVSGNLEVDGSLFLDSSSITFATASTTGDFEVGGVILAADGTDTNPGYTFKNDTDTGLYRGGTNDLKVVTGGTTRLEVTSGGVINIPNLTASQAVFTDASKNLVSNAIIGTGSVVMSSSPTITTPTVNTSLTISSGAGNGIGFWGGAASTYGIFMSNSASYQYGDVTDYYIANVMGGGTSRGFTWSYGTTPSMALNANSGNLAIKGTLTVNGTGSSSFGGAVTGGTYNSQTISSAASFTGTVNATTGFKVAGGAASGNYLRGNGTNFVSAGISAGDVPTLNQNTTGSAATLTTTRTIWGQNFNGSANVTGALSGASTITLSGAISGGTTYSGSGTITTSDATASALTLSGANAGINFTSSTGTKTIATGGTTNLNLAPGGNVGVGTSSPLAKVSIQGTAGTGDLFNVASSTGASAFYINAAGNVGIGTTTPDALFQVYGEIKVGSVVSTATAGMIQWDGANFSGYNGSTWKPLDVQTTSGGGWTDAGAVVGLTTSGDSVSIGTTSNLGKLGISLGSAGSYSANGGGDELVIEDNAAAGISIITPDASNSNIFFGSPTDTTGAKLQWNYSTGGFEIGTATGSANLSLLAGNQVEIIRLDGVTENVGIGDSNPTEAKLSLVSTNGSAAYFKGTSNTFGTDPVSLTLRDTINSAAWTIGAAFAQIKFDSEDLSGLGATTRAKISAVTESTAGALTGLSFITSNASTLTEGMRIDSSGNVGVGTTNPKRQFEVNHASSPLIGMYVGDVESVTMAATGITTSSLFRLDVGGTGTFWVNASKQMSIGASGTTGTNLLNINSAADGDGIIIRGSTASNNADSASVQFGDNTNATVAKIIGSRGSAFNEGYLKFQTMSGGTLSNRLYIASTGNIGITDTTPTEAMLVVGSGGAGDIYASFATASTNGLCWDGTGASLITDCSSAPTDLAENFGTIDTTLQAGDLVIPDVTREATIIDLQVGSTTATTSKAWVLKADNNTRKMLLGVVSTNPNQVYGDDGLFDPSENPTPITLTGRVPVNVAVSSQAIAIGDMVTVSSDTPGKAEKATTAGVVIGTALSSYDPNNPPQDGKILVFINVGWFDGGIDHNSFFNMVGYSGTTTPDFKIDLGSSLDSENIFRAGNLMVVGSDGVTLGSGDTTLATIDGFNSKTRIAGANPDAVALSVFGDYDGITERTAPYLTVSSGPIGTTTADILVVDHSGNVGIGTSTPAWKLNIATVGAPQLALTDMSAAVDKKHGLISFIGGIFSIGTQIDALTSTSTSATSTLFTISDTGRVGIGTTTPGMKLSVSGSVGFDGLSTGFGAGSLCLSTDGEVVYNAGSDSCLPSLRETKHDITPLGQDALAQINELVPVSFIYNDGPQDRTRYGFIAEDAAAVDPYFATYDDKGNITGIDDRAIIALSVKALKELDQKVQDTRNEIQGIASSTEGVLDLGELELASQATSTASSTVVVTDSSLQIYDRFVEVVRSTLSKLGIAIENGVVSVKNFATDMLSAKFAIINDLTVDALTINNKLCVEDVCVDKDQLKSLLMERGGSITEVISNTQSPTSTPVITEPVATSTTTPSTGSTSSPQAGSGPTATTASSTPEITATSTTEVIDTTTTASSTEPVVTPVVETAPTTDTATPVETAPTEPIPTTDTSTTISSTSAI